MRTPISRAANPPPSWRQQGFTTIELIIVLTIVGLMYALATPLLASLLDRPRLDRVVTDLVSALRAARSDAAVHSRPVIYRIEARGQAWRIDSQRYTLPADVTVNLVPIGGENKARRDDTLTFFPDGSSTGGVFVIGQLEQRRRVRVDWLTGQVRAVDE